MKVKPYYVRLADCYILGPTVSLELGEVRVGLSLVFCEIGLEFKSGKTYSFGCSGCGAVGRAKIDELPPGWEKKYRRDHTFLFLCPNCQKGK